MILLLMVVQKNTANTVMIDCIESPVKSKAGVITLPVTISMSENLDLNPTSCLDEKFT